MTQAAYERIAAGLSEAVEIAKRDAEIARLRALLKEAGEVIGPFAETAELDIGQDETNGDHFKPMRYGNNCAPLLTVGDLRRAAAFVKKVGAGHGP